MLKSPWVSTDAQGVPVENTMHEFEPVEPSDDAEPKGRDSTIKYTHPARPQHGRLTNHESSRSHGELQAEDGGSSCREEGCSMKRPMRGVGYNDQFPYRGTNDGY